MDVSLLTFQGFLGSDGKTLLTRNVEVDRADTVASIQGKSTYRARNNRKGFVERAQTLSPDIREVLDSVERMFRSQLRGYTTGYSRSSARMNFKLDYSWQEDSLNRRVSVFIDIGEEQHTVNAGFYPPSIALVSIDEFEKLKEDGINFVETGTQAILGPEGIENDIMFSIHSQEDWSAKREALTTLTRKFREAYDASREKALSTQ